MTKRISSMIMALMLVISAFAIPASAVGSTDAVDPHDIETCRYCKNPTFYFETEWNDNWVTLSTSPCTHGYANAAHLSQRDTGTKYKRCVKCNKSNGSSSVTRGRVLCSATGKPCAIDHDIF